MPPLTVRLCWTVGYVLAHCPDPAVVESLVRREGLPAWVEVGGVLYQQVWGSEARRLREQDDRLPPVPPARKAG